MKRLITCTDGTWDQPGDKINGKSIDSNVCVFYTAVRDRDDFGIQQLKFYDTGVGTGYTLQDKLMGGITGAGIDKKIKDAYTFLVLNYEKGDELFFVGFSRGAYTARSLAGFIRNCGILKPEYLHLVDRAYELYRDRTDYTTPDSALMVGFKRNFCFELVTRIKFIGVWDTVGALGIPLPWFNAFNHAKYKFHDVELSSTIDHAYQALAVDEHRKPFEPSIWRLSDNTEHGVTTTLIQRWFAGVHCDVGGGYIERGLSNQTLQWMAQNARSQGLALDEAELSRYPGDPMGPAHNSISFIYWFLGKVWRVIGIIPRKNPEAKPDPAEMPKPDPSQCVDPSVYERMQKIPSYKPKNVPPNRECTP